MAVTIYDTVDDHILWTEQYKPQGDDTDDRLEQLQQILYMMILPNEVDIDLVAVEMMYSAGNAADAPLHVLAWMIRRRAKQLGIAYVTVPRSSAYKRVVGKGNMPKREAKVLLEKRYGIEFESEDCSDSAIVAIAAKEDVVDGDV